MILLVNRTKKSNRLSRLKSHSGGLLFRKNTFKKGSSPFIISNDDAQAIQRIRFWCLTIVC